MLLLADNFVGKNDLFQAKYVLNTVIDNYKGEDLKQQAIEKLHALEKAVVPLDTIKPEQDIIIDMGNGGTPTGIDVKGNTPTNETENENKNK